MEAILNQIHIPVIEQSYIFTVVSNYKHHGISV